MAPFRPYVAPLLASGLSLVLAFPAIAVTATGRLQIIHLDVGQGDGAVIISPLGQVVMIDNGVSTNPTPAMGVKVPAQLQALGVTHVDHHFASHYHSDHIGLFKTIFGVGGVATLGYGWDRAFSYTTQTYTDYVATVGTKRRTLVKDQVITLDSLSAHPVTIKCVDLNSPGSTTTDENSNCLVLKVSYGEFDMSFGGDLPGATTGSYVNMETTIGPETGSIEAYKVHHHGSASSSHAAWLNATQPKVAVVSAGTGNSYGHPTAAAMNRIHSAGTKVYWTETGSGATPLAGWDKVSNGQVILSATWEPGGVDTIRGNGFADTFTNSGTPLDTTPPLVVLNVPDGGEEWMVGSTHAITWTATDAVGVIAVDLAYSTDGGATYPGPIAIGLANSGSFAWIVSGPTSNAARVRVTARDAAGNAAQDGSNADFRVGLDDHSLTLAVVGAGTVGATPNLVTYPDGSTVQLDATAGLGWAFTGWSGDQTGAQNPLSFPMLADMSLTAHFADVAAPDVVINSPNGGEVLSAGEQSQISWTAEDNAVVDSIRVEWSPSGVAGPWVLIERGLGNSGEVGWIVPDQATDSAYARVIAFDGAANTGNDASDAAFKILSSGPVAVGDGAAILALSSPAPNPAHGAALLRFSLPFAGTARLDLVDIAGRRVWGVEGVFTAGAHTWHWRGSDAQGGRVRAGLYFVRLVTPWGTRSERFVVLR